MGLAMKKRQSIQIDANGKLKDTTMIKALTEIAFDWGCRCFGIEHTKDPAHFAKRNQDKIDLGLTA